MRRGGAAAVLEVKAVAERSATAEAGMVDIEQDVVRAAAQFLFDNFLLHAYFNNLLFCYLPIISRQASRAGWRRRQRISRRRPASRVRGQAGRADKQGANPD